MPPAARPLFSRQVLRLLAAWVAAVSCGSQVCHAHDLLPVDAHALGLVALPGVPHGGEQPHRHLILFGVELGESDCDPADALPHAGCDHIGPAANAPATPGQDPAAPAPLPAVLPTSEPAPRPTGVRPHAPPHFHLPPSASHSRSGVLRS